MVITTFFTKNISDLPVTPSPRLSCSKNDKLIKEGIPMKKTLALILVLVLVALTPTAALADGNVTLSNTDVSVLTISADEWQGDETYFLVEVHTGINTSREYEIEIPKGFVCVVECYSLDGTGDGHLVAYTGNQTVEITVQNGFVGLCTADAAEDLFTERWNVLESNDWARKDVRPLSSWNWTAD